MSSLEFSAAYLRYSFGSLAYQRSSRRPVDMSEMRHSLVGRGRHGERRVAAVAQGTRAMKEPDCGGCKGQGAHSRRCRTQPGWLWRRFEDMADELGDLIGSNDPESANMAYAIAARCKARATEQGEGIDY